MYKLDFLIEEFGKHAKNVEEQHKETLEAFKKMNPKDEVPDYMADEFNLPMALMSICDALVQLHNRMEKIEYGE